MPVIFAGTKLIPGPLVEIAKEVKKDEAGKTKAVTWRLTLTGQFVAYKGGASWTGAGYPPDQSAYAPEDKRMRGIVDKLGQLADLFSNVNDGQLIEIQPPDGSAPIKANVRILNVNIPNNRWTETANYTITLEADKVYFGTHTPNDTLDDPVEETWQLEQANENGRTYRFTHNVSATAKVRYNADGTIQNEGWEVAKEYVIPRLGIDMTKASGPDVIGLEESDGWGVYNYVRSNTIDESGGRFAVSESWLLFDTNSGPDAQNTTIPCIDSFTVNTRISAEDGRTRVTVEGTLTGLEVRNNTSYALTSTKYTNAAAKYAALTETIIFNRAQSHSGVSLNPSALNTTKGANPESGVITYSREYDNRPSNFMTGVLSESIQISDSIPIDIVAEIGIPGRALGPIFQPMSTKTKAIRTIAIEATTEPKKWGTGSPTEPDITDILNTYGPGGSAGPSYIEGPYVERNEKNWNPLTGRYSRTISWKYN